MKFFLTDTQLLILLYEKKVKKKLAISKYCRSFAAQTN